MISFALEFDAEEAMREAAEVLWKKHNITGEMTMRRTSEGRWRLEVHSEKNLRPQTLEKIGGERVKFEA